MLRFLSAAASALALATLFAVAPNPTTPPVAAPPALLAPPTSLLAATVDRDGPCLPVAPDVAVRAYAALLAACQEGWGPAEFACLDWVVARESRWRPTAGPDWRTNGRTQVRWMLGYVRGRYRTPCRARAHWRAHGWY